jgi:hypothetical protein
MPIGTFAGFAHAALSGLPGLLMGGGVVASTAPRPGSSGGLGSVIGGTLEGLLAFGASAGAVTPQMAQLGRVVKELTGSFKDMKQAGTGGWITPAAGPTLSPTGQVLSQLQPVLKGFFDRLLTPTPGQLGYRFNAIAGRWIPAGPGPWLTSAAMSAAQAAARAAGPNAPTFIAQRLTSLIGQAHQIAVPMAAALAASPWARRALGRAAAGRAHTWLSGMSGLARNRAFRRAVGPKVASWVNTVVARAQAHLTPIPARRAAVNWIAVGTSIAKGLAAAGLGAATVRVAGSIAESQNAELRRLAPYSPAIAGAYAMQSLADFQRNIRLGMAVSETARELAESVTRMRNSWAEFDQWTTRQRNRLGSFAAGFSSVFGDLASGATGAASRTASLLGNWMPDSYSVGRLAAGGASVAPMQLAFAAGAALGQGQGLSGAMAAIQTQLAQLLGQGKPNTTGTDPGGAAAWNIAMSPIIPTNNPRRMPTWRQLPGMP